MEEENKKIEKIIVTKNLAMKPFLVQLGLVGGETQHIPEVTKANQVLGKHVFGNLPPRIAANSERMTVVEFANAIGNYNSWNLSELFENFIKIRTFKISEIEKFSREEFNL